MPALAKPGPTAPPGPPGSLAAALAAVPDPRRPNGWRPDRAPRPPVGLLPVAVAAMLGGARSLYAVAPWGRARGGEAPATLVPLGLPPGRRPRVAALPRVCKGPDAVAFERALGAWLRATGVDPAAAVALDGKAPGGIHGDAVPGVHSVAAVARRAAAGLAPAPSPGTGQELAAAKPVPDGDGGRAPDATRQLPADRGGGRALPAPGRRQPTRALGRPRSGGCPPGRAPIRTGRRHRRPSRGRWRNRPAWGEGGRR